MKRNVCNDASKSFSSMLLSHFVNKQASYYTGMWKGYQFSNWCWN